MKTLIKILFVLLCTQSVSAKDYRQFTRQELQGKNIVIIGSFRKCYREIIKIIDDFHSKGAHVLAPIKSKIVDENADFVLFKDDDPSKSEKELQQAVFDKMQKADMVYIFNARYCKGIDFKGNYIGIGTASEIGYVLALNDFREKKIPLICANAPDSSHIQFFCEY